MITKLANGVTVVTESMPHLRSVTCGIWVRGGDIRYVKVRTSLNVRSEPAVFAKKIGSLYNGDVVSVLEEKGSWSRIAVGWVSSAYLSKTR